MLEDKPESEKYPLPKIGEYNWKDVPLDDPRVFALYTRGDTKGLFQVESSISTSYSKKIAPKSIEDISLIVAIVRPGVLETGQADEIVKRRNGDVEVSYFHPSLEPILRDTYGCLVYQEQSIKMAMELAAMSESDADVHIRKTLAKKLPEKIAAAKKLFIEGCIKKATVNQREAEEIFSWIEKGQRYLFNLAHSISYGLLSYLGAYQKCHFYTEWLCSSLMHSSDKMDPKQEVAELIQDAKLHNCKVLPPDIRQKNVDFKIVKEKEIIFGLSHIRGIGKASIDNLSKYDYQTFDDLLLNIKKIKRSVAEGLIKAGACDCYKMPRVQMLRIINAVFGRPKKSDDEPPHQVRPLTEKELPTFYKYLNLGVENALTKIIEDGTCQKSRIETIQKKIEWLKNGQLKDSNRSNSIYERLYLGIPLSCSAADDFEKDTRAIRCREALSKHSGDRFGLHVVIDSIKTRKTSEKSKTPGREFANIEVSDNSASITLTLWPEVWDKFKEELSEDLVISPFVKYDDWNGRQNFVLINCQIVG